ncbi:hypothetical protein PILCRDRAFT_720318 [Piloderma croceum F 1598]|uniref:Uncharacterized protein n=1 Tax=Piloderma croceum (strain F 1598) TaxID=765440 RepID=A0A0C3F0U0_PILCF|nr:hypothetical protein PILCRDRAFT_720318 [Piloderma croceum F 1598]
MNNLLRIAHTRCIARRTKHPIVQTRGELSTNALFSVFCITHFDQKYYARQKRLGKCKYVDQLIGKLLEFWWEPSKSCSVYETVMAAMHYPLSNAECLEANALVPKRRCSDSDAVQDFHSVQFIVCKGLLNAYR